MLIRMKNLYICVKLFSMRTYPMKVAGGLISIFITVFSACTWLDEGNGQHQVEPTLEASEPIMKLLKPEDTGIDFQNQIIETYENNITTNINMYNGGGLAIADINNDGLPDIYFICSNGKNRMYLNEGNLKFKDITDSAGLASEGGFETAVTAVDINNDGFLDFYVCRAGVEKNEDRRNRLYINNGNLTFTERAKDYGLDDMSASTGANFFDYDNDGDLDVYIINYPTEAIWTNKIEAQLINGKYKPMLNPRAEFDTDRMYRNDGGKFTDVSKQTGVWNLAYGLSVSVTDINRDGWLDVYVGNDFIQPDLFYINQRNGTFADHLDKYMRHTTQHTMGTDWTDFDNDGQVDLYAVDMLSANNSRQKSFFATNTQSKYTSLVQNGYFEPVIRNVLQRNNGNGTFSDVGCIAGVFKTDWSWSGLLFDMDNNGWRDLHVTNGYRREVTDRDFIDFTLPEKAKEAGSGKRLRDIYPNFQDFLDIIPTYKIRNFCFANNADWTFRDVSGEWMTIPSSWSCGAVWSDLDGDGDLDLVTSNLDDPSFVYENLSSGRADANYLQIKFSGAPSNPFAVGASATVYFGDGQFQYAENFPSRGIFSSVEHLIHFGLGNQTKVDRVVLRWPDGKTQELRDVKANQRMEPNYAEAGGYQAHIAPAPPAGNWMENQSDAFDFVHVENEFNDFEEYPMSPWKLSELGPIITVGDVNGDGLDDFYVGSSLSNPGALYIQKPDGRFVKSKQPIFEQDAKFEDHGGVFFDVDGDGDQDLFLLSGGIEAITPIAWTNRLYINTDGKGNFAPAMGALPALSDVYLRAVAFDYDGDGDQDLILGGRVTPKQWPLIPRSVILRNEGNRFVDVTKEVGAEFERVGMITDLQVASLKAGEAPSLIVCGEWMPVSIFRFEKGKLRNKTKEYGLDKSDGFWFRMALADLDGDGDLDIVSGNLGLNTRLTASAEGPLRCFAADFDKNGTLDPIMAYYEGKKLHPLLQKEVLNKHMPILKKKFLYAKDYSKATMDQIWPQKDLDASLNLFMYTLETCWWENKGGTFVRHSLPVQAQLSAVQGIAVEDFNGDGNPDIMLVGNKYGMEVETNQCNASNGVILAGSGKGQFTWVNNTETGFWAMKQGRDLAILKGSGGLRTIVVANNNSKMDVYRWIMPMPQ
jgi:enediyne biosynthesis protein E4